MPPDEGWAEPASVEEMAERAASLLDYTDQVRHENDILYVVNYAREQGIHDLTDFARWLDSTKSRAMRSRGWEDVNPSRAVPPPDIAQIARYLKAVKAQLRSRPVF